MHEHPIDVDATIKRLHDYSARVESIKQRMLRRELDPETAWQMIRNLGAPPVVRVKPDDLHELSFYPRDL